MAATTPGQIAYIRLFTLRQAIRLEARGMKMSSGRSALSIAKSEGYKGSRETILAAIETDLAAHPDNPNV